MFRLAKSSTLAVLVLAITLGTVSAVLVKHHAAGLGMAFAMVRLGVAAPVVGVFLARTGKFNSVVTSRGIVLGGMFWGLGVLTFFYGASRTSSLNTGLIAALGPVITLVIGGLAFRDRVARASSAQWLLGVVATIATAAAIVVSGESNGADRVGDISIALSIVFGTFFLLYATVATRELGARNVVLGSTLYAAAVAVPLAILSGQAAQLSWKIAAVGCVAAVCGTSMNFLQTWATTRVHPGTVALSGLIQPLQLAFVGSVFFDESIAVSQAVGGLVALAAVAVLARQRDQRAGVVE